MYQQQVAQTEAQNLPNVNPQDMAALIDYQSKQLAPQFMGMTGSITKSPAAQIIEAYKSIKPNAKAEAKAISDFMSQFDDPIEAAARGDIGPLDDLPEGILNKVPGRNKAFAKWFNSDKGNTSAKSSFHPNAGKDFGDYSLPSLKEGYSHEDARQAIMAGQNLGYKPEDIAHYLIRNYIPGGMKASNQGFDGINTRAILKAINNLRGRK
jgi:hypothetical protein